jgi:tetratricopeptide (TPR) repeat protein
MAPGNPALWLELGEARAAQGDLKGAWYAYAKALRLDPALGEAYRRLGPVLRRLGHSALADQAEVRAFQLSPSDPGFRDVLVARGWSPAALVDLVLYAKTRPACVSDLPAVAQPTLWTARWAARRKDWNSAARRYARLAEARPGYQPVWAQLGHALKEGGDLAAAEGAYLQALALTPNDADIHLQLGHALKLMGRRAEAAEAYRRACELKPGWAEARHERDALEGRSSATADTAAPGEADVAAETPPIPIAALAIVDVEGAELAVTETPPPSLTGREARYWRDLRRALSAAPGT